VGDSGVTLQEARDRVREIEEIARAEDDEVAHSKADRLHQDVLRYLAEVAPAELGELARIAISTEAISFARWCA
jgi:hypothetical protein